MFNRYQKDSLRLSKSLSSPNETEMLDIDNADYEISENDSELRDSFNNNDDFFVEVEELYLNSDEEYNYFQTETSLFDLYNSAETEEMARSRYNHNNNNSQEEFTTLKEECKYALLCTFKAILYLLFMPYWIVKESIKLIVALFAIVVSTFIVEPLLLAWSGLVNYKDWIPGASLRKRVTTWFILIVLLLLCIPVYKYNKSYRIVSTDHLSFGFNLLKQSNENVIEALASLEQENMILWNNIKKAQEQLLKHEILLNKHDVLLNGIEGIVRSTIENELPEQIFVGSDKYGQLELSPAFITSFQRSFLWNNFIKKNDLHVKRVINKNVEDYIHQQQQDGAIVSKQMFMKLLSEKLLPHRNPDEDIDLNFQSLIDSTLIKYHQDVLNKADFALASRGAYSLVTLTSLTWYPLPVWIQGLFNFVRFPSVANSPDTALTPDNHVGACWRMYGDIGTIGISLSEKVRVNAIAIEYPSKEVIMDMSTAPKNLQVFGIEDFNKKTERWSLLGDFDYDINKGEPIQVFDTIDLATAFKIIVVKAKSNWGHKEYTDFYRVRVHGEPVL